VLASVGPPIPDGVIDLLKRVAGDLGRERPDAPHAVVHVISIARIWGTSFGLPNPGLYPNRLEIEEQRDIVDSASDAVRRGGFVVKSRILSARDPAKVIARYAESIGAKAIVVGDPAHAGKAWERAVKANPVRDLGRRTRIPIHSMSVDAPMPRGLPARRRTGGPDSPGAGTRRSGS
jgi:hypothetical protein